MKWKDCWPKSSFGKTQNTIVCLKVSSRLIEYSVSKCNKFWLAEKCRFRALCCEDTYPTDITQDIKMAMITLDFIKFQ